MEAIRNAARKTHEFIVSDAGHTKAEGVMSVAALVGVAAVADALLPDVAYASCTGHLGGPCGGPCGGETWYGTVPAGQGVGGCRLDVCAATSHFDNCGIDDYCCA